MPVKRERIKVQTEVESLCLEYMTVGDAINQLEYIRNTYGADARFMKRSYDYSDGEYLAVMVEREETDDEYAARTVRIEENEKREFERLKKKFGS